MNIASIECYYQKKVSIKKAYEDHFFLSTPSLQFFSSSISTVSFVFCSKTKRIYRPQVDHYSSSNGWLCSSIQLNIEQSIVHDHRQQRSMCHNCRHKLHIQRQSSDEELRVLTSKRIHCVNTDRKSVDMEKNDRERERDSKCKLKRTKKVKNEKK